MLLISRVNVGIDTNGSFQKGKRNLNEEIKNSSKKELVLTSDAISSEKLSVQRGL